MVKLKIAFKDIYFKAVSITALESLVVKNGI
jgi:hypothetical protein